MKEDLSRNKSTESNKHGEFIKLIQQIEEEKLLKNCSYEGSFHSWEKRRKFIKETITNSGTFFDIGCANAFFIRCLEEWSGYSLIPYGIDIDTTRIQEAQKLYPHYRKNFIIWDKNNMNNLKNENFPLQFNFVYDSRIFGNFDRCNNYAKNLYDNFYNKVKPGGRLILGFYDEDEKENQNSFENLTKLGIPFSGYLKNPRGTNLVAWVDKSVQNTPA